MPRHNKTEKGSELGERIGRNIKVARSRIGVTQVQLANAVGIDSATVSKIETGAQLPSLDRLDDIAQFLKVSLPALVCNIEECDGFNEAFAEVINQLSPKDKNFVFEFTMRYAQHLQS